MAAGKPNVFEAAKVATEALEKLDEEDRARGLRFVADALGLAVPQGGATRDESSGGDAAGGGTDGGGTDGGDHKTASPKEFMASKDPSTKSEEIACLAYYLSKYRGKPHFKPADITELNTEAQGNRFDHISRDLDNAKRSAGLLTVGSGGMHQINRLGEQVVEALPDHEAVKALRRKTRRPAKRSARKVTKAAKK